VNIRKIGAAEAQSILVLIMFVSIPFFIRDLTSLVGEVLLIIVFGDRANAS